MAKFQTKMQVTINCLESTQASIIIVVINEQETEINSKIHTQGYKT